jgi:8-oxo-dGTP pyrophosphatase MutT (NUDIX family)
VKEAAVLVPLFRDAAAIERIVLVVRGSGGVHGGQLALPGGAREPGDEDAVSTALREAWEEVGLPPASVVVTDVLDPVEARTTQFAVTPVVARITPPASWIFDRREIAAVVTPTLSSFADPARRERRVLSFATWPQAREVDVVELDDGAVVWGLTLRLLDAVLPRVTNVARP